MNIEASHHRDSAAVPEIVVLDQEEEQKTKQVDDEGIIGSEADEKTSQNRGEE